MALWKAGSARLTAFLSRNGGQKYSTAAKQANREARLQLAACYRFFDQLQMSVTASSLIGLDRNGAVVEGQGQPEQTAGNIHLGVRDVVPNKCVFHLHPPYSTALGCLKDPTLTMSHQNAARFYQKISYDKDYDGHATERAEGQRLGGKLSENQVLIMCNHGAMTVGPTAAMAFDHMYYLERAAMFQILALSSGRTIDELPTTILKNVRKMYDINNSQQLHTYADAHFAAMYRKLQKDSADFEK